MKITSRSWGQTLEGQILTRYEVSSPRGISAAWTNYGATLLSVKVPAQGREAEEVLVTFDTPETLLNRGRFFGAVVGRWANRIAQGQFTIGQSTHQLRVNMPPHHLHGGSQSFSTRVWDAQPFEAIDRAGVVFTLQDPAGTMGYPGNLQAQARYWLTTEGGVGWELQGTTDAPTILNLVNHAYWNLGGFDSQSILDHRLTLPSRFYYPRDETGLPTQQFAPVEGTPFDFRQGKPLGQDLRATGDGYDHCYVLEKAPREILGLAAQLEEPTTGRRMEIFTQSPCLQLYTGNFLGGDLGAGGRHHQKYSAVCLETQLLPDAPNRQCLPPGHPSPVLLPGELWSFKTLHRFSW